jgi:triosephosphate isomerase
VSVAMLRDAGVRQVIVGHSERRHTIGRGEDDRMINLKVRAVLAGGLAPILCVGETLAEREAGRTLDVLTFQVRAGLVGVSDGGALTLAYEPVWAIGTGRNATPGQAQEAHVHIRAELRQLVGSSADRVRVLYGGSVKPDNARDLFSQADVDGGLIGGASLKADAFGAIVRAALASGR